MKKIKYLAILITILLTVGCGSKDGEKVLKEALENTSKVTSGTIQSEAVVSMGEETMIMNMQTDFTDNHSSYSQTTFSLLGTEISSYMYSIVEGDKLHTYSSEDGTVWNYEVLDSEEYLSNLISTDNIGSLAKEYKSVSEIKSDKDGYTKLEVVIDKNKMMDNLEANQELGSEADFELDKDIKMYVYVKDGYITNLNIDFTDVLASAEEGVTNYSLNFTISHHNQIADIIVPEEVTKNAVEIKSTDETGNLTDK